MSQKYFELTAHLAGLEGTRWKASFDEIESILGFPLPESARTYQAWWANQMRSQSLGWQLAGWKTADLDLQNERVTFVYVGGDEEQGGCLEQASRRSGARVPLTIAEAKAGLAVAFGVDPSQIEIIIKG